LIIDDDANITTTFKAAIEDGNNGYDVNKRIEVYTSNDPVVVLSDFKPNYYDLLLVDINMPRVNGFELCEKILATDLNVRICFMSSVEINREGCSKRGQLYITGACFPNMHNQDCVEDNHLNAHGMIL